MARDWLKTLYLSSYKGVSFWVETDEESGSRRIVEHEFPMSDLPYNEDLGEGVRHFEVVAYLASDRADGDASALGAVCSAHGPGILVLPSHGPILVRCLNWKRNRNKDRHGYIGFTLTMAREGSASPLVSVLMLANLVFVAADAVALAVAASFVQNFAVSGGTAP